MPGMARGLTRERFIAVKERLGDVGSWAVWAPPEMGGGVKSGIGDLSVFDLERHPELASTLNTRVVMLGINGSGAPTPEPFSNFHDPSPRANHFKLRHAYSGTPFWGAYLTDTFKGIPTYGAKRTSAYLHANPALVRAQLADLADELAFVGCEDPLLIAFGRDVYDILQEYWGDRHQIVRVPHYAHFLSKEKYRDQALAALSAQTDGLV